jgi:raffinose/stachyose/melibiose transport system permease protein
MKSLNGYRMFKKIYAYGILLLMLSIMVGMLLPFLLVTVNAFKSPAEYAEGGPLSLPETFHLEGITGFWERVDYSNKLINSFVISISVSTIAIILSCLNGYALGIGKIKGKTAFLVMFVMANTLPQEALAYPLYYMAKFFSMYDTKLSIIIIFSVIQSAFGTYFLSSIFSQFPESMLEAAKIDGCNKLEILTRIVLPNSFVSISVLFTFFFIWTWNEFFIPLIMLVSNSNQTVPIAVSVTQGQHNMNVTMASASALLGILPCIVFFIIFQRTLTRGITSGSTK